jgi:hypothetical protein
MAQDNNREVIYGLYDDEEDLLRAVKLAKTDHLDIYDVFSPFPVHGLDPLLGLEANLDYIKQDLFMVLWAL